MILLIIVALAALKYFLNWDVFDAASSEQGRSTIDYIRDIINTVWSVIGYPVSLVWDNIFWPILKLAWQSLQSFLEFGKSNSQGI